MSSPLIQGAKARRAKGIYLLPNLVTIGSMFAGFYAIIAGLHGHFEQAVIAIFVALVMDGLDGRIARWTHSESDLGAQLDSLADMVSFGVAPAMVMYSWSVSVLGKPGWMMAFMYMVCTGLRLARFNSQAQNENKRYFYGLNTPSAAALVASTIWTLTVNGVAGPSVAIPMAILLFVLGLLKVSVVRYRSFKDINLRRLRVSFLVILLVLLAFMLICLDPPEMLLAIILTYVLSGPLSWLWHVLRHRRLPE